MSMRLTAQGAPGPAATGSGFEADLDVMTTASGYVAHVGDVMFNELNKLMNTLGAMDHNDWSDDARTAWDTAMAQWLPAANELRKVLQEDIAPGLDNSQKTYNQAITDNQIGITNAIKGLSY